MRIPYKREFVDVGPRVGTFFGYCNNTDRASIENYINDKLLGREFEISDHHIVDGVRDEPESCPFALGLADEFNVESVSVGTSFADMHITRGNKIFRIDFMLDKTIRSWICDFDTGKNVKPMLVELKVVDGIYTLVSSH